MLKQSSSRNQRVKGVRVKRAVHVIVFIVVCIWLLYQVKHFHDNKKAFEGHTEVSTASDYSSLEKMRLGRKGHIGNGIISNVDDEMQDEEGSNEAEEEPEFLKEEADEEDGGVIAGDEIDERDDERVEEDEGAEELAGNGERKGELRDFEKSDHNDSEMNLDAQEELFGGDDVSDAVVRNPENTESPNDHTDQMDRGEARLGMENGGKINDTMLQEDEILFPDDSLVNERAFVEDAVPEGRSASNLTILELKEQNEQESNLTDKVSLDLEDGELGDSLLHNSSSVKGVEAGNISQNFTSQAKMMMEDGHNSEEDDSSNPKNVVITEESLREKPATLLPGGIDDSTLKDDPETVMFTLPEDQSDAKYTEDIAAGRL